MRRSRIDRVVTQCPRAVRYWLAATLMLGIAACGGTENTPNAGASGVAADSAIAIAIGPTVPADISGGSGSASLLQAAVYAWQEFIALNWPAVHQNGMPGTRDVADANATFGDPAFAGPLVWQTFRAKVEIFPGAGAPHGYRAGDSATGYGYDDAPRYIYDTTATSCTGDSASQAPWINLDETSQVGLDHMYAGIVPPGPTSLNSRPNLVRFLAKANRAEYEYVVRNGYWNHGGNYAAAQKNFTDAIAQNPPVAPTKPYIDLDAGTIEIKAAWRVLAPGEQASRFYTTKARYYERSATGICYREDTWALIALHIMHKTPSAPSWIYATFEQADNILTPDGKPIEDENGSIIDSVAGPSTQPALSYTDSPSNPLVSIVGTSYCEGSGKRLFYRNFELDSAGLPAGGNICVNRRDNPIPQAIVDANRAAHRAIAGYAKQKGITNSPWMFYKLVNVQARPFDNTTIDAANPNGNHNPATYYTANSVVETNYTLALFHGRFSAVKGIQTDYPTNGTKPDFKNVYVFPPSGSGAIQRFNMGGCMGCHGMAQVTGTDFTFLLNFGPVLAPDLPPAASASDSVLVRKYRRFIAG